MQRLLHPTSPDATLGQPGPVMNTTPLIDLMLVLLVMFIVSIPIATHKVPLDAPIGLPPVDPAPAHRIDLNAAGRLSWDGRPISDAQLPSILARHAADPAEPELHIAAAAETRYERVDQLLAAILRAGITRTGFVGNDRFAQMMD